MRIRIGMIHFELVFCVGVGGFARKGLWEGVTEPLRACTFSLKLPPPIAFVLAGEGSFRVEKRTGMEERFSTLLPFS